MKTFLKYLIYFFIPIILIVIGIEVMVRVVPNSYKFKSDYLLTHSNELETLILGSSHTFYGVNPQYLYSKSFNASNVSQSPDIDYAILKTHENALDALKHVVIRLSYDTLFEQIKNSSEDWRLKDYKIYMNLDLDYKITHNSELVSMGLKQSLKVLKNYYLYDESVINSDSLGFGTDLDSAKIIDLEITGIATAKRHSVVDWSLLDDNIGELSNILYWCEQREIKVFLITPPAYKSYVSNLNNKQLNEMITIGNQLDREYTNCSYYNFLNNPNFIVEDFYDADHLNAKGAKKFSLLINSLIEN